MFWIQEIGNKNNSQYKLFYAEEEADLQNLPTQAKDGTQTNGDSVSNKKCCHGCECLVLSTADVYYLKKSTDTWEKLGG